MEVHHFLLKIGNKWAFPEDEGSFFDAFCGKHSNIVRGFGSDFNHGAGKGDEEEE